ncbi:NAD(P)-binding protein [Apiospora kogelbergensis]|uniref:NAD(P)-binding protein n=1 Tax=Apiospora kogelbergensis TaxID=1337665 RepID=A0AAW0QM44_9PEZI
MIHTSGPPNLADRPISGNDESSAIGHSRHEELEEFDDMTDDIYGYEKRLEAANPYAQRTAELGIVDTGLALGVKTLVIMSGLI